MAKSSSINSKFCSVSYYTTGLCSYFFITKNNLKHFLLICNTCTGKTVYSFHWLYSLLSPHLDQINVPVFYSPAVIKCIVGGGRWFTMFTHGQSGPDTSPCYEMSPAQSHRGQQGEIPWLPLLLWDNAITQPAKHSLVLAANECANVEQTEWCLMGAREMTDGGSSEDQSEQTPCFPPASLGSISHMWGT